LESRGFVLAVAVEVEAKGPGFVASPMTVVLKSNAGKDVMGKSLTLFMMGR